VKTSPKYGPRMRTRGSQEPSTLAYSVSEQLSVPTGPITKTSGSLVVGTQGGTHDVVYDIAGPFKRSSNYREWKLTQPFTSTQLTVTPSRGAKTTAYTTYPDGRWGNRMWSGDGVGYVLGPIVSAKEALPQGYDSIVNTSNLTALAVVGCLNRINPASSQSLVTAAEAGKTVDTILSRAKKLADAYLAVRRGDVRALDRMFPGKRTFSMPKRVVVWGDDGTPILNRKGKPIAKYSRKALRPKEVDLLTDAARLELEFRYGWTPLVYDIVDSLKAIYAQQLRDELTKRDFTKVFERKEGSSRTFTPVSVPLGGGTWTAVIAIETKVSVKAYAKYTVTQPTGLARRLNDFGIFDIPRAVWELAPLSFVADWVIPIGDWLGAVTPKVGVNVIDSGTVVVTDHKVTRTLTGYTPSSTGPGSWPDAPFPLGSADSFQLLTKVRSPGLPIPLIPPHEVKFNLKRLADAAALLRVMR